jgi:hypothetical protein
VVVRLDSSACARYPGPSAARGFCITESPQQRTNEHGRGCAAKFNIPEKTGAQVGMSAEDLENYETEMELHLYREYRDVVSLFAYVVETERRFYLANQVDLQVRSSGGEVFFEVRMADAWVWDVYRPARFVKSVRVVTFKDVNIEELNKSDLELPKSEGFGTR